MPLCGVALIIGVINVMPIMDVVAAIQGFIVVYPAPRDQKVRKAHPVPLVNPDRLVCKALLVYRGLLELKAPLESKAQQAHRENPVLQVLKASPALQAHRENQVLLVLKANPALLVLKANPVLQVLR